jgi:pimeloyl-ACP methyl ester carboxylesterase
MILHVNVMGDGKPLALLHGLFGQSANFGLIQRGLAARFRVIALDLRNHGASPHAPRMTYADMAEDVLETLRALGALPCAMMGHSMGGKVALTAALEAPAAIAALAVADIAPVTYRPAFRGFVAAMQAIPLASGLTRAQADAMLAPAVEAPEVRAFLLQNLRFGDAPAWKIDLGEIAAALPIIEGWKNPDTSPYRGPALFIAGARSDYIRSEYRPAIRALCPAARFVTLKNAGHWLHADNPVGFIALLEAFFG